METCSSREDLVVKVRKPYTITKQRERWTDEEHRRFLEAVKLYGRAWQKIEEHVGSKTAIQIRSHAQKFFTKLEKEALRKGLTLGQAQDIDIPPPRPKRKPSNPYPRKTCTNPMLSSGESISPPYQKKYSAENAGPEKPAGNESLENGKMISENGNSSAVLAQVPDASCPSISSVNEGLGHLSFPGETLSLTKGMHGESVGDKNNSEEQTNHCTEVDHCTLEGRGIITKETDSSNRTVDKNRNQMPPCCHKSSAGHFKNNDEKHREAVNANPTNPSTSAFQAAAHGNPNLFAVPSFAPFMPSIHNLHGFPSCTLFPNNQDVCRPFNNSPAFLNLIISTLQQNPAVFAAARLAASSWPGSNGDNFLPSGLGTGGIPERDTNPSPGMTAVAAATVAAATAWWAMHGMLPFCPPFPADFSFATPSTVTNAMNDSNQTADAKEAQNVPPKALDAELSNAQMHRHSAANLSPQQSSDSDEIGKSEDSNAIIVKSSTGKDVDSVPVTVCPEQSNKVKLKKKQDRSSCSSNTPSSCDDTDIILENLNNIEGKMEDMQAHLLKGESNARRSRSSGSASESWKEVSEEGRIAFRALFSREVLPQSFSPPEEDYSSDCRGSDTPLIDLNSKKGWANDKLDYFQSHCNSPQGSASHSGNFPSLGQPGQGGLEANRTGFKPYKRCSLEAKETNAAAGEENGVKRIRLEDEASSWY